ncbi:MAG: FHA domain-containing protein [Acidimicrobiia bacterium]
MRRLERRLETVLERTAGQLFRGAPHVSELAGSLVRVLDLSTDGDGLVPNRILVPKTVPAASVPELEEIITEATIERGWRIECPVRVVPADVRNVTVTVERGDLPVWAVLVGVKSYELRVNRSVIGRSSRADVVIEDASVSRMHTRVWRQDDRMLCADLNSSNGTRIDGVGIGSNPAVVSDGASVAIGALEFVVRRSPDA